MPKLTNSQLKNVKYVSMADFSAKIDQLDNFDDMLKFTTRYLLSHGMNGEATDYSLEEAIHLAKLKLVDASKQMRDKLFNDEEGPDPADLYIDEHPETVNPYAEDEKDDIENQFFMADPGEYLKGKAQKFAKEIEDQDVEMGLDSPFKENCQRLSQTLDSQKSREILVKEDKGMAALNLQARMEANFRGRKNLIAAQNEIKPGFFTRVFSTRSTAGKNFDEVYAAFNNPKHALYGNMDALEKATTEYLSYKDSKKSPAERATNQKEPKEQFASRLLDCIKEQKQNDEVFKTIVGGSVKKNLTQEAVDQVKGMDPEEQKVRIPIELDLSEDDSELDMSQESEPQLEEELEKEEEVEQQVSM